MFLSTFLPTPLGRMLAVASDRGLAGLEFDRPERATRLWARLRKWHRDEEVQTGDSPLFDAARRWLTAYFEDTAGAAASPTLDLAGTDFEQAVWRTLIGIERGQTTTYGAIAASLGRREGARAVGLAVGSNPVSLIVPCHRVVGADGSLTGYGGGLDRKEWLLRYEHARGVAGDLFIPPFDDRPTT
jgi:O-6-methylguanine DNA methyltransferase